MNFKNENGITLVALIVTIVVMVILAAIAISASVDDNGLIKQTQNGVINASIREVQEALDTKLLLKEKEEIKKGNLTNLAITVLTGEDTPSDNSDDILILESGNTYIIDISKLDIKGDYGKGESDTDVFKLEVELDDEGNPTKNYNVTYVAANGTTY